jgi:Pvc16 N-terminal domain
MNANAIVRATEALRDRLAAALAASAVPGDVFVGPLDDPDAAGAKLILLLYRVMPNQTLRNGEHRVVSANPAQPAIVFQNALPLDLYFLLTVGTNPVGSEETLLGGLGFAMQSLQFDPELGGPLLGYENVRVSLEPLNTDEISRIWSLFPTANYRTSVAYVASPVWIDPPVVPITPAPVMQDTLHAGSKPAVVMS